MYCKRHTFFHDAQRTLCIEFKSIGIKYLRLALMIGTNDLVLLTKMILLANCSLSKEGRESPLLTISECNKGTNPLWDLVFCAQEECSISAT